jgi:CheY-like chemotaxis protein
MAAEDMTYVVIAEDDDDDYYLFSIAISETSYKVVLNRAENGKILLQLLEKELPNIVFLDLLLPVLDGRHCLKEIRSNKRYDSVPVIAYSSLKDLDSIEYCYREGSNLYVLKPSSYADLKKVLERILAIDWKKTMYYPPRAEFVLNIA